MSGLLERWHIFALASVLCISTGVAGVSAASSQNSKSPNGPSLSTSGPIFFSSLKGTSLDGTVWENDSIPGSNGTIQPETDGLHMTLAAANSETAFSQTIAFRPSISGDFDVTVYFRLLNWPSQSGARVGIGDTQIGNVSRVSFSPFEYTHAENYVTDFTPVGQRPAGFVPTSDVQGTLRFTRTGKTYAGYYWNGSDWSLINSFDGAPTGTFSQLSLSLWGQGTTWNHENVEAVFSDFAVWKGTLTPSLVFPLKGTTPSQVIPNLNPYSAQINTVFDHSMLRPYSCDNDVQAYTGEYGDVNGSGSGRFPFTCEQAWQNPSGNDFFLNGSSNNGTGGTSLYYDGHPGVDYQASYKTPVYAAASGVITYPKIIKGIGPGAAFHVLEIQYPDGLSTYGVYYLHLNTYPGTAPVTVTDPSPAPGCPSSVVLPIPRGKPVSAGCLIGLAGYTGAGNSSNNSHLHFEVHRIVPISQVPASAQSVFRCLANKDYACIAVDPYGWDGPSGGDKFQKYTGLTSIRLWSYTPAVDSVSVSPSGSGTSYTLTILGEGFSSGTSACIISVTKTNPATPTCMTNTGQPQIQSYSTLVVPVSLAPGTYRVGVSSPNKTVLGSNWKTVVIP